MHVPFQKGSAFRSLSQPLFLFSVFLFWPIHRLGHSENYIFSLKKLIFTGAQYPKSKILHFEDTITAYSFIICSSRRLGVHVSIFTSFIADTLDRSPWTTFIFIIRILFSASKYPKTFHWNLKTEVLVSMLLCADRSQYSGEGEIKRCADSQRNTEQANTVWIISN